MRKATAHFCGLLIVAAGASLSACGKNGGRDTLAPDSQVESGRVEDQFGKGFGEAFRADPNSEPANVSEDDVKPVSLTAEPVTTD